MPANTWKKPISRNTSPIVTDGLSHGSRRTAITQPSFYQQLRTNRGKGWLKWLKDDEILALGNRVREFDTTRPVIYDGDRDVGDATVNYHYPEGYGAAHKGSIYRWEDRLHPDKPTGIVNFWPIIQEKPV